jgi:hypothetical protein
MKMSLRCALIASITLATAAANAAPIQASSVQHFTGRCLDTAHRGDKDVNCEVSGVVKIGQQLFFANDKPIQGQGTSTLFSIDLQGTPNPPLDFEHLTYLRGDLIDAAEKLEGLTKVTFDYTHFAIATNAFTRASNPASSRILYWPVNNPRAAKVLGDPQQLRQQIGAVVGEPFFQVEGIAVDPDKNLLLGIRRLGADSKTAKPDFIILRAPMKMHKGEIVLSGELEQAYRFTPKVPGDERPLSLSGLEYDPYNKRLLATTSHEDGEKIGGYLWSLPLSLLSQDHAGSPQPVLGPEGQPLWFDNKPEGVEVLSESQVMVVHDDDRVQVTDATNGKSKKDNEFAYSVVTLRHDQPDL